MHQWKDSSIVLFKYNNDKEIMNKDTLNLYLSLIFKVGLTIAILSTFFLFGNFTTDSFETPKFLVLLAICGVIFIVLTLKFVVWDKVTLIRTPLDLPLLLLLVVAIISTILSQSPYVALLGNQGRVGTSLAALFIYILFYFLVVNNLKTLKEIKFFIALTYLGGALLSAVTLLAFFGVKFLPAEFNQAVNFTPTGLSFTTTAILSLLIPPLLVDILAGKRIFGVLELKEAGGLKRFLNSLNPLNTLALNSILLTLFGITIVLTGTPATYIGASFGLIVAVLASKPNIRSYNMAFILIPLSLVVLVLVFSFIPPVGNVKNPLSEKMRNFPREISLDFITSWKVSVSAFRDHPFWGSGPSTYVFNFTSYKPIEFNNSKFWNLRFDSSFNEYLGVLGTLGGVGLLAFVSLFAFFASSALRALYLHIGADGASAIDRAYLGLAVSGLTFFVILLFHSSTLPFWVFGLLILAEFFVVTLLKMGPATPLFSGFSTNNIGGNILKFAASITSPKSAEETVKVDALPGILLVVAFSLTLAAFFFGGKFALADYHHRQALKAVGANDGLKAYNELVAAEKLNPYSDLYRINIAQTNFALANGIAASKGPTEASPSGSLTDTDRQNIQVLLQQAINEGRVAVQLSPSSAVNWEILGNLYRQIAGVAENALLFSLDSYGRAIFQDPLNPLLRLNVGGTYYAIKNYDLAIRFFTDSANLKPDFPNAYYNLSVALKDKGDLVNAQAAAEKTLTLIDVNSQDYKVASDYLADLKKRIEEGTVKESQTEPPAAQTEGALQDENLPEVVNLPKPESIATPSAVKKPNATPEPTTQP